MNDPEITKLTPMMKQWQEAKELHKDAILLFRMGDFYELFDQDAIIAAPILDLCLTSRDKDKPKHKMAGFPHHAAAGYIQKLLDHGHKVAMCEQLEDPKNKVLVVKRGVTNVITPGTVINDETTNNSDVAFICAIISEGDDVALCSIDYSNGIFKVTKSIHSEKIIEEILRIAPKELLVMSEDIKAQDLAQVIYKQLKAKLRLEKKSVIKVNDLPSLAHLSLSSSELKATQLILSYIFELKGQIPAYFMLPRHYLIEQHSLIDETTRFNLDLIPQNRDDRCNLYSILDDTKTAMGKRLLLENIKAPLMNMDEIYQRQSLVNELLLDQNLLDNIRELLGQIYDLNKLVSLLSSGKISPRSMGNLRNSLVAISEIKALLSANKTGIIYELVNKCPDLSLLTDKLVSELALTLPLSVKEGGIFKSGIFSELDKLKNITLNGHEMLLMLEAKERERTLIPSLKIKYTRVFGYYIEITKTHLDKTPSNYFRKQTVANAERFTTEELTLLENQINSAESELLELESSLFNDLCAFSLSFTDSLLTWSHILGLLDLVANFAYLAHRRSYIKPIILAADNFKLNIRDGRHPIIEELCHKQGIYFVPNHTTLDQETSLMLITGPNMAGKSTIMRQVALIQIMAQIGSYVPASYAELSLCDAIFARVGASDDPSTNRSTFMVEMTETAAILRNATINSLIILDEIGRGTSTYDGISIAQAVAEYIHNHLRTKTMFATHYHELTYLENDLSRLKNFHVKIDEKENGLIFLYAIASGPCHKSFGIEVAKLSGLPQVVLDRASVIINKMEEVVLSKRLSKNYQPKLFNDVPCNSDLSNMLISKITGLDINKVTPLEALNQLATFKQLIHTHRSFLN